MKPKNLIQPLTEDEIIEFGHYLERNIHSRSMLLTELHGMVTAIISSPRLIMPSEWQQDVLGKDHVFDSMDEANYVYQTLAALQNHIILNLDSEDEFDFLFYDNGKLHDLTEVDEQLLKCWCEGYLRGTYFDDSWKLEENAVAMLFPLAILSERFSLIGQPDEAGNLIEDDSQYKVNYRMLLPSIIKEVNEFWRPSRFSGFKSSEPIVRATCKIGRNESCPCGSGRKYKKCCYLQERTLH